MQIKVANTKMHKLLIPTPKENGDGAELYHSFKEVAEAKLILVNPNQDVINSLTSHSRLATAFKEYSIETGKNHSDVKLWWKRSETKLLGIPILISETEKIEVGDWFYTNLGHIRKCVRTDGKAIYFLNEKDDYEYLVQEEHEPVKVLALPEHFSSKHLQAIADGKMKDGDKVLIECEEKQEKWANGNRVNYFNIIKFNLSNYITLHKVEEKIYTEKEIRQILYDYASFLGQRDGQFLPTIEPLDNWFEQNVKIKNN